MPINQEEQEPDYEPHENENDERNDNTVIELQLGDIIKFTDPTNEILNEQTFIIDYIDLSKIKLINTDTLGKTQLTINPDKTLGDNTITSIILLSRHNFPGYARQHNLIPNTWITIFFEGDVPFSITGEITNLEEDMIELKMYPDGDIIYINFDFKGIPEEIPIESILIREKPEQVVLDEINTPPLLEEVEQEQEKEKVILGAPINNVKAFKEIILQADQIKFGKEDLGAIVQQVDVDIKNQRYSIETQTNDLLDDLLSRVPNRTKKVLNNIHQMIERFIQLREKFSFFDQNGNINEAIIYSADYKPLERNFQSFDQKLYWVLPVVKNIKKVYYTDDEILESNIDTDLIGSVNNFKEMNQIIENYKTNNLMDEGNKYSVLFNELNPYFTPFNDINVEDNNFLIKKDINDNINTVVNNLDDLNSSVFDKNRIKNKRFMTETYNVGLKKLYASNFVGNKMISSRGDLTPNDIMCIKSFLTLPEPTLRFSRINLPGSSLLDKSNLNHVFLNYWQLLKKNTKVNNVVVTSLKQSINYSETEDNFVNNIKNYILNLNYEELKNDEEIKNMSKLEIYNKFINTIIPKTKILFNLMKKHINGKLSIVDVVSYLEPFLIYTDYLTYAQYSEITNFIDSKITSFNKNFLERLNAFAGLNKKFNVKKTETTFSLTNTLNTADNLRNDVFESYDITGEHLTNSEVLRKLMIKDCGKLYNSAVSLESAQLMFSDNISGVFTNDKTMIQTDIDNAKEAPKNCNTIVIAKFYENEDELLRDNFDEDGIDIYFDKKYDTTNYGFLDEYEKDMFHMSSEDFITFLKDKLKKNKDSPIFKNNDETEVDYFIDTLINGHKKVIDGQYAVLYLGKNNEDPNSVNYYIRKNNKWEIDETIDKTTSSDSSNIICNLQERCISISEKIKNEKCESIELNKLELQHNLLQTIINEFDNKYNISQAEFIDKLRTQYNYNNEILPTLIQIETENMLKYNNAKYKLGVTEEKLNLPTSPYIKLRNIILQQNDLVKKSNDIIKFVNNFTRKSYPPNTVGPLGDIESDHWLYCVKTDTKLLPAFKYGLACAFVEFMNVPDKYNTYVDLLIVKLGGKKSDDGDFWVDENSGWPIQKIDFDLEEGYTSAGFKVSTRALLNEDVEFGKIITSGTKSIIVSPETKMINNIISAVSFEIGVNLEILKSFIINGVIEALKGSLPDEYEHTKNVKEMANKGKTIPSYEVIYYTAILYNTLGMMIVAIQTSIPSIKTRKTFPGCVKSFSGYPFDKNGGLSSLEYLSCVAYHMRNSHTYPWKVMSKTKSEFILKKLQSSIEQLLELPSVKRKIDEKTEHILFNREIEIPHEHNILSWSQFLPPLVPFKITHLDDISREFKIQLTKELKSGLSSQREKILTIQSKIIMFSLALQEKIQNIVKKKQPLLTKSNNEPYLENACCNEVSNQTTIQYFENADASITEYNNTVTKLSNIMNDIVNYSKSILLCSNINTKNIYPPLIQDFSNETIYFAFIYFCNFKTLVPINPDLLPLCNDKPEGITSKMSIAEIVAKLKAENRNFTNETFLRLLQIISRKNIINIDVNVPLISPIRKLADILAEEEEDEEEESAGEKQSKSKKNVEEIETLISNALDTFDIATTSTATEETKKLYNFLVTNNEIMRDSIITFIHDYNTINKSSNALRKILSIITNLSTWKSAETPQNKNSKISNDSLYNVVNFFKIIVENISITFPNIILNKVNYANIHVPSYWKLSVKHNSDIAQIISSHYAKLEPFYENQALYEILRNIKDVSEKIIVLSKSTPSFTSIEHKNTKITPIFDEEISKLLFEYYFLKIFNNYIDLSSDTRMVVSTIETSSVILNGNIKELRQNTANLLLAFIEIIGEYKNTINISYENILDLVFKTKEKEKNIITSKLKALSDEEREADTILKINKLGSWGVGLQKGFVTYEKEAYEREREFREIMEKTERTLRKDTDHEVSEYEVLNEIEQNMIDEAIDRENLDMSGNTGDDGNYDDEYEDTDNYADFDS